uniref:Ras guanine nucleotide exchange factor P-like n=1 Tax=Saccoglossus kowalevskii TaxID=10224 RepID=A0ABM0MYE2_SACKO|nr:PREDICTED: ras guanine nucleotide exchange factor P-like [Saccoglossus kowalevskii]
MKGHTRKTCPNSQSMDMQMTHSENNGNQNNSTTDMQQVKGNLNTTGTLTDKNDDITDKNTDTAIQNNVTHLTENIETDMATGSTKNTIKKRTRSQSPVSRKTQNGDNINNENNTEPILKKRNDGNENEIEIIEENISIDEERVQTPPSPPIASSSPPAPSSPSKPLPHVYANVTVCNPVPQPDDTVLSSFPPPPSLDFTATSPRYSPLSAIPLGLSGITDQSQDVLNTPNPPDQTNVEMEETVSECSDNEGSTISEISTCTDSNETAISNENIKEFLVSTLHSRRFIDKCFEFCFNSEDTC